MKVKVISNYDGCLEVKEMVVSKAVFNDKKRLWKAWLETGLDKPRHTKELKYWYNRRESGVFIVSYDDDSFSFIPIQQNK
jgi:hypothetical protein